jgi:class 3 adenylate cyclase
MATALRSLATGVDRTSAAALDAPAPRGSSRSFAHAGAQAARTRSAAGGGERRQVTVLAARLVVPPEVDPEVVSDLLPALRASFERVAQRLEGRVVTWSGEAATIVFGHPVAHEDDAARAARASAEIAAETRALGHGVMLRQGIHTGIAVVQDPSSAEIVGEAPRLAAALEGAAGAGEVRVSAATQRLVGSAFTCEPIAGAADAFRLVGERDTRRRDDRPRRARMVGRTLELGLLRERWEEACEGRGQVVVLVGEPGIGKSRLVDAIVENIEDEPHLALFCQGSPYHRNVALHPFVELLRSIVGLERHDATDSLAKLERFLDERKVSRAATVPWLAPLLSVSLGDRYVTPNALPVKHRQNVFEAVLATLFSVGAGAPLLLVVEDAHWLDPTTLELLALLDERVAASKVLLLVTARPELRLGWAPRSHRLELTITRLTRKQAEAIVVAGSEEPLPPEIVGQVLAKADGVPLFVEELAREVRELRAAKHGAAGAAAITIPATLKDSLTARLDRLGTAKEIAQIASAIGREVHRDLLEAVCGLDADALERELVRLVDADILHVHGAGDRRAFVFKHALIQDAAYQSLVRTRRVDYHSRIARALEERFADVAEAQPELLAHHFTESEQPARAIAWWRRAGERAMERTAHKEASSHILRGLELIAALPADLARDKEELELRMRLGLTLSVVAGYGVPAVGDAFARAQELAVRVDATDARFHAMFGLWLHRLLRAELGAAREIGRELGQLADATDDLDWRIEAHRAQGTTAYMAGDLGGAGPHLEWVVAHYRQEKHAHHGMRYGFDPGVIARIFLANVDWMRGDEERAETLRRESLALSRALAQPLSVALALEFDTLLSYMQRRYARAAENAAELRTFASDQGFAYWRAIGEMQHGWALARQGDLETGLAELERGRSFRRAAGGGLAESCFRALDADALHVAGRADEALAAIAEGLASSQRNGDGFFDVELFLLRAEILRARAPEQAEESLRDALTLARKQGAHKLGLRAAIALARALQGTVRHAEAAPLLGEALGRMAVRKDADADVRAASALLEDLA